MMAIARHADAPEQLWLGMERPIQPPPTRERRARIAAQDGPSDRQIELRMTAPRPSQPAAAVDRPPEPPLQAVPVAPDPSPEPEQPREMPPVFAAWLLDQGNRRGTIGDLAKAAKLDRLFPRRGDADAVRARFSAAGADGDAFEALDDAEREHARACA